MEAYEDHGGPGYSSEAEFVRNNFPGGPAQAARLKAREAAAKPPPNPVDDAHTDAVGIRWNIKGSGSGSEI